MSENIININISEKGKVLVSVNGVVVGMLKEVKLKVMARKNLDDLLEFSAKQLEVSNGAAGMASEFNTIHLNSVEEFINKILPACAEGNCGAGDPVTG